MKINVKQMRRSMIFTGVSLFFICNILNYVTDQKYQEDSEKLMLAIILAALTGITLSHMPTVANVIKNKLTLSPDELENMFEQLTYKEKEFLFKKDLVEKDSRGDFYLKYICPITLSLMRSPAVVQIRNSKGEDELELYDESGIIKWIHDDSHSGLSPLTNRDIVRVYCSGLQNEIKDYMIKLEKEMIYVKKYSQKLHSSLFCREDNINDEDNPCSNWNWKKFKEEKLDNAYIVPFRL